MLKLSNAGVSPTHAAKAINHLGEQTDVMIAGERPLSIKIDEQELERRYADVKKFKVEKINNRAARDAIPQISNGTAEDECH